MAKTTDELHQEHRNMARLLDLLEAELAIYRDGGVADFDLVRDIMDYTTSWLERYHHPKENLIFEKLKDKGAEAWALAADLVAQHETGEELTRGMATLIGNVAQDAEIPRDLFERLAREYLDFNRRHMEKEEAEFLPLAEAALSAEDWAAIEAALSAPDDPLFGPKVEERYRRLLENMLDAGS
jgi:hemerythrin-like domain-containing protein